MLETCILGLLFVSGAVLLCACLLRKPIEININVHHKAPVTTDVPQIIEVTPGTPAQPAKEEPDLLMQAAQKLQMLFVDDNQIMPWEKEDRP